MNLQVTNQCMLISGLDINTYRISLLLGLTGRNVPISLKRELFQTYVQWSL